MLAEWVEATAMFVTLMSIDVPCGPERLIVVERKNLFPFVKSMAEAPKYVTTRIFFFVFRVFVPAAHEKF